MHSRTVVRLLRLLVLPFNMLSLAARWAERHEFTHTRFVLVGLHRTHVTCKRIEFFSKHFLPRSVCGWFIIWPNTNNHITTGQHPTQTDSTFNHTHTDRYTTEQGRGGSPRKMVPSAWPRARHRITSFAEYVIVCFYLP